jgi:hypothetical protein
MYRSHAIRAKPDSNTRSAETPSAKTFACITTDLVPPEADEALTGAVFVVALWLIPEGVVPSKKDAPHWVLRLDAAEVTNDGKAVLIML